MIIELAKEHIDEVYDLFVEPSINLYPGLKRDEFSALVDWAVFENPYQNNRSSGYIYRIDGIIKAVVMYSYRPFCIHEWTGEVPDLEHLFVHPSIRGVKGVLFLQKCIDKVKSNYPVLMHAIEDMSKIALKMKAIPITGSNVTFSKRLSYDYAAIRKIPVLSLITPTIRKPLIDTLIQLCTFSFANQKKCRYTVSRNVRSIDKLDEFYAKFRYNYNIGVIRDQSYIRWRYAMHPNAEQYTTYYLYENTELRGIFILQDHKNGIASLCEVIYDSTIDQIEEEIILACMEEATCRNFEWIRSKIINNQFKQQFHAFNFIRMKKNYDQYLIFYPNQIEPYQSIYSYGDFLTK